MKICAFKKKLILFTKIKYHVLFKILIIQAIIRKIRKYNRGGISIAK